MSGGVHERNVVITIEAVEKKEFHPTHVQDPANEDGGKEAEGIGEAEAVEEEGTERCALEAGKEESDSKALLQSAVAPKGSRDQSLDLYRGVIMALMIFDHTSIPLWILPGSHAMQVPDQHDSVSFAMPFVGLSVTVSI